MIIDDMPDMAGPTNSTTGSDLRLRLLDGFRLERHGRPVNVAGRSQRLLALLALHGGAPRTVIAGTLWPEVPEGRARASVRAAVCEIQRIAPGLVHSSPHDLDLSADVGVDVVEVLELTASAVRARGDPTADDVPEQVAEFLPGRRLAGPLLPGWTDDWLLAEIERIQQLRVHALDIWAARLLAVAAYPLALSVAEAAVLADPLRESAHRRLMEVHLAQGNTASALRQYQRFSALLREELGIRPSRLIQAMADRITGPDAPGRLITR